MAITRAQQAKQMLQEGGRIGFKGGADMGTVADSKGRRSATTANVSSTGAVTTSAPRGPTPGPDDRSSDLQTINQLRNQNRFVAEEFDLLPDDTLTKKDIKLNEREKAFEKFLDYRRPVKGFGFSKFFEKPMQVFSDFNASINRPFFEKVVRAGKIPGLSFDSSFQEFEDAYQKYMANRLAGKTDAYGNPTRGFSYDSEGNLVGNFIDDDPLIIPFQETQQPQDPTTPTPTIFQPNFRVMADGGMTEDAPVEGGIMDLESGRQMYFLGKLVKKATRAIKKIVKSPIGKAALAFGAYKLGSGFMNKQGLGGLLRGKLLGTGALYDDDTGTPGLLKKLGLIKGGFGDFDGLTGKGMFGLGSALTLAPFLFGQEEEEQQQPMYQGADLPNPVSYYLSGNFPMNRRLVADGGRIEYDEAGAVMSKEDMEKMAKSPLYKGFKKMYNVDPNMAKGNESYKDKFSMFEQLIKKGYQKGGEVEPVAKKTMPLLDMDGKEKDYRETGGFVDMGRMERADDVPARLSKNEFVFTADAVRNAGEGDIDKGAEVMYNMMKNLEAGGEVSEESQGLEGARRMFQTSQRLGEVI